ncbi:unnamed protein product [Ambrosiozyma monospora]|uniref:Unnamed protein product n=1 Tax=Ambrosiozyma monospora TaxID=43982 RepID=A0ACB5TX35_AMBMO|nr:unnamed protein product [Ambrosiozyma monospora]
MEIDGDATDTESDGQPLLQDKVMLELFTSNVKQVMNHSTLLVNHYIPKNLLLLDSKQNFKSCSYKYKKMDDILNKLIERKQTKTVIVTAPTSQELDLIESVLIGKNGLQYYRFSGASLYYEHHGSFNFNKESPESDDEPPASRQTGGGSNGAGSKKGGKKGKSEGKGKQGKKKKSPGVKNGKAKSRNNNNNNNTSSSGGVTNSHRSKNGEEYIPRISKNNPEYEKLKSKNDQNKLSIYLIVSNQLKSLIEFEELKSDLIISLDSNLKQVSTNRIPIIKPIALNSIEYFETVLKDTHKPEYAQSMEYLKLLTQLVVANRSKVQLDEDETNMDALIDWALNYNSVEYPLDLKLPKIERGRDLNDRFKDSLKNLSFCEVYELQKYQYFQENKQEEFEAGKAKRAKLSKFDDIVIPERLSFKDYQMHLADLVYNRFKDVLTSIESKNNELSALHYDDSRRQADIEEKNVQIGECFKKLQASKTKIEGLSRQEEKLKLDKENMTKWRNPNWPPKLKNYRGKLTRYNWK